jgi:hypothetical protein
MLLWLGQGMGRSLLRKLAQTGAESYDPIITVHEVY